MKYAMTVLALSSSLLSLSASALTFDVSYDSSTSAAPAGFVTSFQDAIAFYENTYSNPITISLNVGWGEIAGKPLNVNAGGESLHTGISEDYASVSAALAKVNPQYTLPGANQVLSTVGMSTAEAAALGFSTGSVRPGGSVGFSSSLSWNFNSDAPVANEYSFISIAEHEISEVMGRTSLISKPCTIFCAHQSVLDLFRYTAAGTLDSTGTSAYFSIDGGKTKINSFNGNASVGDLGDWARVSPDAYNYSSISGIALPISAGDLTELTALGYTLSTPVPLPNALVLLASGFLVLIRGGVRQKNSTGSRCSPAGEAANRQALSICT